MSDCSLIVIRLPRCERQCQQFFFCTDRYSWEWSEDAQQLPTQASDSLCLTMDSNVIGGLPESEDMAAAIFFSFLSDHPWSTLGQDLLAHT